jgi:hypothetical protein
VLPLHRARHEIHNHGWGVGIEGRNVFLTDVTVSGHTGEGVKARAGVSKPERFVSVGARRASIVDNGLAGIAMDGGASVRNRARLADTTIERNGGAGVSGVQNLRAARSSVSDNATHGISWDGSALVATLSETVVANNGRHGIEGASVRVLRRSSLTGNGSDTACGVSTPCADVATVDRPLVDGTSACDVSYVSGSGLPGSSWGVCALD